MDARVFWGERTMERKQLIDTYSLFPNTMELYHPSIIIYMILHY